MPDTPLNPDALATASAAARIDWSGHTDWDGAPNSVQIAYRKLARAVVSAYLAVAQPEVNSVEELDQLPSHTVIEEHEQGHGVLIKRGPRSWECLTHYVSGLPSGDIELPARVLYRPEVNDA